MRESRLPDVASRDVKHTSTLDWVGMGDIRQPIDIRDGDDVHRVEARVQLYVDLANAEAKGIHMSRLYLILDEHAATRPLTPAGLKLLLKSMLVSHRDLSGHAFIEFAFDYFLRRPSLVSDNSGWNSYPVAIRGSSIAGEMRIEFDLGVWYSSTCPASAALARQLIQEQFERDFGDNGPVAAADVKAWLGTEEAIAGTPHGQRSIARARLRLDDSLPTFPVTALVSAVEDALSTPVQTAVKREDEQEFARLNAANLMFCEDAGRRLKAVLDGNPSVLDFHVRIEHHESLHAHAAVSVFAKGVAGGYPPTP
ncbi:MAG: GTP cyclohydrolase I FolE2 [Gammaproteobacteria bacterium]|nr:GTP cyclohydrolase I FolE2 [Gammaproteobacteria bacterium]